MEMKNNNFQMFLWKGEQVGILVFALRLCPIIADFYFYFLIFWNQ
jgi:hypothetical protein